MFLDYLPALAGTLCIAVTIWFLTRCNAAFDGEHARVTGQGPVRPQEGGSHESRGHHASPRAYRTA
jgi:hypothetical protein